TETQGPGLRQANDDEQPGHEAGALHRLRAPFLPLHRTPAQRSLHRCTVFAPAPPTVAQRLFPGTGMISSPPPATAGRGGTIRRLAPISAAISKSPRWRAASASRSSSRGADGPV